MNQTVIRGNIYMTLQRIVPLRRSVIRT